MIFISIVSAGQDDILPVHLFGFGQVTFQTEHLGLRRAVDVGVEDADPETPVAQGDGKVGRDGRFSDTALARSDRYDVGYVARHGRFVRSLRFLGSGLLNNNGDGSFQGGKILFQQCLNLPFDLQGEGIAHFGEIQGDGYLVAGSRNLFDESALDKTVLGLRMEDTVE